MSRRARDDAEDVQSPARAEHAARPGGTEGAERGESTGRPSGGRPESGPRPEDSKRPDLAALRPGGRGAQARLWLLLNGSLQPVSARTGLDDGTLIEVSGPGLKAGDAVVVNAIRPDASPAALLSEAPQQARGGQSTRQQGGAGPRF
jgi:hypothetical protein